MQTAIRIFIVNRVGSRFHVFENDLWLVPADSISTGHTGNYPELDSIIDYFCYGLPDSNAGIILPRSIAEAQENLNQAFFCHRLTKRNRAEVLMINMFRCRNMLIIRKDEKGQVSKNQI